LSVVVSAEIDRFCERRVSQIYCWNGL